MRRRAGLLLVAACLADAPAAGAALLRVETLGARRLPARGCPSCRSGDYLVSDGRYAVFIGATPRPYESFYKYPTANAMGSILAFLPPGEGLSSNLMIGSPYLRFGDRSRYVPYTDVKALSSGGQDDASLALVASARYRPPQGGDTEISTTYRLVAGGGRIDILSSIRNAGNATLRGLKYAIHASAHQIYEFSPFDADAHPDLRFRVYPKDGHYLAWVDNNPPRSPARPEMIWDGAAYSEEAEAVDLRPGESLSVRYSLLVSDSAATLLERVYRMLGVASRRATVRFRTESPGSLELVVRETSSRAVFFRSFLPRASPIELSLPPGLYLARAHFFPGVDERALAVPPGGPATCVLQDPPRGRVHVSIRDAAGAHVPGKVTFIGVESTRSPYFRPHDPVRSGKYWESFRNSCFPPAEGLDVELPAGTYLVHASRGPEFSLDQRALEIAAGASLDVTLLVDRVVLTPALVSVDPHIHTLESDGSVTVAERIRSLVAEGVDVAVATDHNTFTDFRPALKALGLEDHLSVLVGAEVSVPDLLDYNSYPVLHRQGEPNNGAVEPWFDDAGAAFRVSRERDPGSLIQVNHPRGGKHDYFHTSRLDEHGAASAGANFDASFDLLEVVNGPRLSSPRNARALQDWFHLLDRGHYFPLVGSSDSHEVDRDEPGYSRTYVRYEGKEGAGLDARALIEALKKGRSFASNGPIVELTIDGRYAPGDLLTARDGRIRVAVRVEAPPWMSIDEIGLYLDGRRKETIPVEGGSAPPPGFSKEIGLTLERDSYMVVLVAGKKSLYPLVQQISEEGRTEAAVYPYALTNPVFVDVDGNGRFDPPLPGGIRIEPEVP